MMTYAHIPVILGLDLEQIATEFIFDGIVSTHAIEQQKQSISLTPATSRDSKFKPLYAQSEDMIILQQNVRGLCTL